MPNLQQIIKNSDKEFDSSFVPGDFMEVKGYGKDTYVTFKGLNIKSFIHARDKAILEGVKEMVTNKYKPFCRCLCDKTKLAMAYNSALRDIINLINKEL